MTKMVLVQGSVDVRCEEKRRVSTWNFPQPQSDFEF